MLAQPTVEAGRLWHPFAAMASMNGREIVLERGEGVWVQDSEGRRYLDATAGLWYCNVGHGRTELAEVAADQMRRLAAYHTFDVLANRPALELADRICELAPLGDRSVAFFVSGGSDAVDTAAKIARRFWVLSGEPQRKVILARDGAYHGMNAYGTSMAGIEANASGWGPLVADVLHVPHDSLEAIERVLIQRGSEVAAFIGEPVQGAGGVRPPAPGYWEGVNDLCQEHGILLIADEVITGFGRVGEWFGCQRYGIEPDMMLVAKGITSGYVPLGAVIASGRIRDVFWREQAGVLRHGYTYSGHPTACAVALKTIAMIERENLIEQVRRLEVVLGEVVGALSVHPLVKEVRIAGLLAGIELTETARASDPRVVDKVVSEARSRGVLTRNLVGRSLQVSPPFVITPDELHELGAVLAASLDAVSERYEDVRHRDPT
jgi:putrescine---pyruvate transaminase